MTVWNLTNDDAKLVEIQKIQSSTDLNNGRNSIIL